ncbi:transposable element Tcb2 transposase [Trichonephila clavipes]|nr:transposable element Tcb2 transposase [Trichonephila clavipes]
MCNSTPFHIFDGGSVTAQRNKNKVLESHMRLIRVAIGQDFIFMDDNAGQLRGNIVDDFFEEEGICRMEWSAKSSDPNPIEHV